MVEKPVLAKKESFFGLSKARIDRDKCIDCGKCLEKCRFNAINDSDGFQVDFYSCEGCGVCEYVCPTRAVTMQRAEAGKLLLYKDERVFSTAKLNMGFGNSGMLVSEVKKQLDNEAPDAEMAIIDGSPGIGCPVIASVSGVDMVLVVTEPTLSGFFDMTRIIETAEGFMVNCAVCINKYDINIGNSQNIEKYCDDHNIPVSGKIPFDPAVVNSLNKGIPVTDIDCPAGNAIMEVYENTFKIFIEKTGDSQ
jgi:MinD superfamily P-loop ATPase